MNMATFRIPRRQLQAEILLQGGDEVRGVIHAPAHGPHGRPGGALDRLTDVTEPFLPLSTDTGTTIINTLRILTVRVAGDDDHEAEHASSPPIDLELHLIDGSKVAGSVQFTMPPEESRLLDYVNSRVAGFIPVATDHGQVLVNRRFVVSVEER